MRLIDKDALTEVLEKMPAMGFKNIDNQTYILVLLAQVFNIIEQQPTIEERKKGEWIDYTDEGYVECPFCHSATNCEGNKDELHYCFSCGARMHELETESRDYENKGDDD